MSVKTPSSFASSLASALVDSVVASVSGAVGIGALAIGQVKYQAQSKLLKKMASAEKPVFLDFHDALDLAREYVSSN